MTGPDPDDDLPDPRLRPGATAAGGPSCTRLARRRPLGSSAAATAGRPADAEPCATPRSSTANGSDAWRPASEATAVPRGGPRSHHGGRIRRRRLPPRRDRDRIRRRRLPPRCDRRTPAPGPRPGLSGAVSPPVEHPQRAEGVPAARRSDAVLEVEVDATRMDAVEQPAAVGLPLGPHDARRPRPSGDPGPRRRGGSSRGRAARRSASSTGTRTRGTPGRRPRRCSCAGTGCARAGTPPRRGGPRAPRPSRRSPARTRAARRAR